MAKYSKYAPEFKIKINGENIPIALRNAITSITYQDGIEGADRVEISISNDNLRWLDHSLLSLDNKLTLAIGYAPDPLKEVFFGGITGVSASFSNGTTPTLTVVAHDFLNRLERGSVHRSFALSIPSVGNFPIPDPIVAGIVAGTNLLIPLIDPIGAALSVLTGLAASADPEEAEGLVRVQKGSNFEFLSQIAKDNGWEMYIDHTLEPRGYVLRFKFLIQNYSPNLTLKWGESLMDFTPRISNVGQVLGVTVRVWVETIKMEFSVSLSWDYDRGTFDLMVAPGIGKLSSIINEKVASKTLTILDQPVKLSTAPRIILSELLPRLNNRLTGTGSAIGDSRIRSGEVINLEGLGQQFSGLYRITSATHIIDSGGYRTNFDVRKEVWFGSTPIPKGIGVQGQRIV